MRLVDLLKDKDFYRETGAVNDDEIKIAENELGLCFSNEYTEYLKTIGSAVIYGHEFTGLGDKAIDNVVNITSKIKNIDKMFPNNIYVIEECNIDGILICQDDKGNIFEFHPKSKPIKIFNSFAEYIKSLE